MSFSLLPREEKFFDLFEDQAEHICKAARIFKELLGAWDPRSPLIDKIRDVEHESDIITHDIIDKLNRTFITPFDREDIHELATEMDDVVDLTQGAAARLQLYKIDKITEELPQLAGVLLQATEALKNAILSLTDMSKSRRILDYCIEINRLENIGDQIQETGMGKLFADHPDPLQVIKWKEIYEITETAIDKCEDVANTIESIVVKHG
ncbi:MAG: hypothetical protein A3A86_08230 [Elusimicrobia bacterium RIFCSPLOWO2_01_FULL_60_11]|nr:MAG: hypothetical protein A3A86_08230 [Elusimicrobia bacterium RIFCSPLOWO2_01_FULL_60_11]